MTYRYGPEDVGPGWRPVVAKLIEDVRRIDPDLRIGQIKEKFGGLRFYYESHVDDDREALIARLVADAEAACYKLCEYCGSTENVQTSARGNYWVKTACDDCAAKKLLPEP